MKTKLFLTVALGLGLVASSVLAQDSDKPGQPPPPPEGGPGGPGGHGGPGGPGGRGPGGPPPPPPILLMVFDTDKDGTLSADEIKKASESLAKLDKDGDGKLSKEELCPPPPPPGPKGDRKDSKKEAADQ